MHLLLLALLLAAPAAAQRFSQRGFLEFRGTLFPQTAPNDPARAWGEALFRWEPAVTLHPALKLNASLDARTDSHHLAERSLRLDWQDRRPQRPAFSLRRLSLNARRGPLTAEIGKQFIRWGKADILNPTDRFAPRDYLNVTDPDFLAVTALRVTFERGGHSLDAVAAPRFTPARTPLLNQRWVVLPAELYRLPFRDLGSTLPTRAQFGLRWNRVARGYEHSLVFYDGHHYLPLIEGGLAFRRVFPQLRLYGGDLALPTRWFTVKSETAWFTSRSANADEYLLWVIQAERTLGEWVLVGGYAGEQVTRRRNPLDFAPDRGLARAVLARAAYTLGPTRSFAAETALRASGDGLWLKSEYSEQLGAHWRATFSFALIRGAPADFLGQFRRNSHALLILRYSF